MSQRRINVGKKGEQVAVKYLQAKGFVILEQNYRTRQGELDIVARHGKILVFVEVKTRTTPFLDSAIAAVTRKKMNQINLVAQQYLSSKKLFDWDARFDVIGIELEDLKVPHIEHIENAFDATF